MTGEYYSKWAVRQSIPEAVIVKQDLIDKKELATGRAR